MANQMARVTARPAFRDHPKPPIPQRLKPIAQSPDLSTNHLITVTSASTASRQRYSTALLRVPPTLAHPRPYSVSGLGACDGLSRLFSSVGQTILQGSGFRKVGLQLSLPEAITKWPGLRIMAGRRGHERWIAARSPSHGPVLCSMHFCQNARILAIGPIVPCLSVDKVDNHKLPVISRLRPLARPSNRQRKRTGFFGKPSVSSGLYSVQYQILRDPLHTSKSSCVFASQRTN